MPRHRQDSAWKINIGPSDRREREKMPVRGTWGETAKDSGGGLSRLQAMRVCGRSPPSGVRIAAGGFRSNVFKTTAPPLSRITCMVLQQISHNQKNSDTRDLSASDPATSVSLPPGGRSTRNSLPPRKYRKGTPQAGFTHLVVILPLLDAAWTMWQANGLVDVTVVTRHTLWAVEISRCVEYRVECRKEVLLGDNMGR
jgi:hypothetical protein